MSRRTQARRQAGHLSYAYGAFTLSRRPSQTVPLVRCSQPVSPAPPYNPMEIAPHGLGYSPFARRY